MSNKATQKEVEKLISVLQTLDQTRLEMVADFIKQSDFVQKFYTVPEAAELLRVHENTIYNLVRAKKIEHYKVGTQIRITASELEKFKVLKES